MFQNANNSVGVVENKYFTFANTPDDKLKLSCGQEFGPITVCYETYGILNKEKNNAVLICHALSGDAHAAGYSSVDDEKTGWWDIMIGPGKPLDTNKYFVICSNIIGGCKGTTGPSSIDTQTGKKYGPSFPMITISDMVHVQKALIDHLEIEKLLCVIGGSMGGMQVLQWTINYPEMVSSAIPIATTGYLSAQALAFNAVGRNAITSDPNWKEGQYTDDENPSLGLAIARMVGHITYLSPESMHNKFGRKLQQKEAYGYNFSADFQIESYLNYQGVRFVERFDANTYLYFTKAMDYFDLVERYGTLKDAFKDVKSKFLVISFSSDWLFPTAQSKEIVRALIHQNIDVSFIEIETSFGHDAFLLENDSLFKAVSGFLNRLR